ncbi:MAG: tetratricopeptide repeat protein [Chthoniobacteraceae bacterium]
MRPILFASFFAVLVSGLATAAEDPLKDAPTTYRDAIIEAMKAFTVRDFGKARETIEKADAAHKPTTMSLNILGAIAIEGKRFDEGRDFCQKALKLDPKFFPARFNLAEIPFIQGQYAEARAVLEDLLKEEKGNDLIKFRIFLTYLLEKNDVQARARLEAIPLINDTPISFYAHSAWDFAHGNDAKAREWIASALRSFPAVKQINFIEVFYDLGWIKREQPVAGDAAAAPALR